MVDSVNGCRKVRKDVESVSKKMVRNEKTRRIREEKGKM